MKYLKLFEELKAETYSKAASKLKQMGHERRSKEIYDWTEVVRKREAIENWSKLGTFEMSFYETKWNLSTRTTDHKHLFDGQFYIGLEVDMDFFYERISDIIDGGGDSFFIIFYYGIFPANEETAQKLFSIEHIKKNSWNGGYWESNFSIKLSQNGLDLLPKAEAYVEPFENYSYKPSNRREAIKFQRLLVNIFEQKVLLPVKYGTIEKLKNIIEEKTGDKEIWNRILNSVKNMPLNYLYRD